LEAGVDYGTKFMADMISEINESLAEKGSNCEGLPECCQLQLE